MVFWVFGYGSLVWNPGFDYDEKVMGFIKDYKRVFDLACTDHRGTPEDPARTLTLEKTEGSICYGAAYCVRGGAERERLAMEYLEQRECEYDQKTLVEFYKEGDALQPALTGVIVFTSTPDKSVNKYYLGPAPLEDMARQIAKASGPCGNNWEYLFKLEKALYDIGHEEDYVIELANEVRKVLGIVEKGFVIKEKKSNADIEEISFTSTPDKSVNKYYLGPAPLEDMARQIATASGPCGNNREYLFKLEKALYDIGHEEDYVIELANEVRKVLGIVEKGFVKKEKKLVGSSHIPLKTAHNITALKLHRPLPLSESVGVAMDS